MYVLTKKQSTCTLYHFGENLRIHSLIINYHIYMYMYYVPPSSFPPSSFPPSLISSLFPPPLSLSFSPSPLSPPQNHLQLSHAQVVLNTEPRPEQYQNIIIILLVIARLHPQNLCFIPTSVNHTLNEALGKSCDQSPDTKGDGCGLWKNIVKQLNELFWLYYHKRPVNSVTCSVLSMGKSCDSHVTCCHGDKYCMYMYLYKILHLVT